ncbi:MAG: FAD-dependent monooxygenase [Flavobacteriia bacterium]|nr:FAD-dependent monooxygenase [Flavobacteriia bacterium]
MKKATVVGAGLVGSLWSVYLAKRGYSVDIYEARPDMRAASLSAGRSINLALSDRGWKALEKAGLGDQIREVAIPMYRRVMHAMDGSLTYQPYGKENQAIWSVSRGGLNRVLMDLAEREGNVQINFEHKCRSVDLEKGSATFTNRKSGEQVVSDNGLLFGTDGAFSAVRKAMQRTDRFNYQQEYIEHGYKELSILPNEDGSHKIEKNALHIWPRGEFMLIALPNMDGSFTCTLFHPYGGDQGFDALDTDEKIKNFFKSTFPDAYELMPNLMDDWHENPTSSLVIIRCFPWTKNGKVALLGDASHAIVPFYGQGMNAGFEDCTIFEQFLEETNEDWEKAMKLYEEERKPNGDAIADLAMQNFVEMRDLTGDPKFLLRKKIERKFSTLHPEKWLPLYSMVTFSHIPYAEANAEGKRQDAIMEQVMAMPNIEEKWDSQEVMDLMNELS